MSFTGKSQGSEPCPPDSQLRKIYATALQSRAKDTVISRLESRIEGFRLDMRDMKLKDSIRIVGYKKDSAFTAHQNYLMRQDISKLNKSLKWQKVKGKIFGGGLGAAIVYIAIKSFFIKK